MAETQTPITVSGNALPTTLASLLRYLVATLGTFLVAKGYVNAENLDGIATLAVTAATVGYGVYKSHQNRSKLIVAAEAAPNSVAKVV
jgi:hypothetical protein